MASSSSTSTTSNHPKKHHVFLSFRGEDTRYGFVSHLGYALETINIPTFIDYNLKRGEEVSPSLLKAIKESMISVITFSESYASSKWCLDELVKILECRKIRGQIVIPIFYHVDPSDIRQQTGSFGYAFAELVKKKALKIDEERCFRDALIEATNISGLELRKNESESKFIKDIVTVIIDYLSKLLPNQSLLDLQVGSIDKRAREVESLLEMESSERDFRIVGIWGMGGIGKTTIARAVYEKFLYEFEGHFFVENISEELKRCTVVDLQRRFSKRLLGQKVQDMNRFIMDRLHRKKVLMVFDNVDSSMDLHDLLLKKHGSFGAGSRILVTSRDRHVLEQEVHAIYEVEALNHSEACRLFNSSASNKTHPSSDHIDLVDRMVNYTKGNPLALRVLGSALCDRSKEDWHSVSNGLGQIHPLEIQNVLRISYDGLNVKEKNVFLHIACFFKGMDRRQVEWILDNNKCSHYNVSVLIDKCLITDSGNEVGMHDLLQEMAYAIVREKSEDPGELSRLFDPEDIYRVLKEKQGTKAVKGICLDMPESMEMELESDAFAGMPYLEFLIIKGYTTKVHLPHCGLEYLSNRLRYFRWHRYPLKSLPQNFCAENLVECDFFGSKFEKLWSGQQNLVNLRTMELSYSKYLTKLPDLSKAKQLQYLSLEHCESLTEIPSYFQYFENLDYQLRLDGCYNLKYFPRIGSNMIKLVALDLCYKLEIFPEIMKPMEYLEFLSLRGSAIRELPSSIQFLPNLRDLWMSNCKQLSKLPSSICKLQSLCSIDVTGCSNLETFPEIMAPMVSLCKLYLSDTGIRELPSSIMLLKSLRFLFLDGTIIKEIPELPPSLEGLTANDCESLETISSHTLGDSVHYLRFAKCLKLDQKALMAEIQLRIQCRKIQSRFGMVLPGSKIPQWFSHQSTGSSITIQVPSKDRKLKGIAFCLVFASNNLFSDREQYYQVSWDLQVKSNNGEHRDIICSMYAQSYLVKDLTHELDHMSIFYDNIGQADFSKYFGHHVTFEFEPSVRFHRVHYRLVGLSKKRRREIERHFKPKSCGVHLVFDENPDQPSNISDEALSEDKSGYFYSPFLPFWWGFGK